MPFLPPGMDSFRRTSSPTAAIAHVTANPTGVLSQGHESVIVGECQFKITRAVPTTSGSLPSTHESSNTGNSASSSSNCNEMIGDDIVGMHGVFSYVMVLYPWVVQESGRSRHIRVDSDIEDAVDEIEADSDDDIVPMPIKIHGLHMLSK